MRPSGQADAGGARLIVNADDYGYFDCVSKGILRAATQGIVTATGVFANAEDFAERAAWLRDCEALDPGVHLNLTFGAPLTSDLRRKLPRSSGAFAGKYRMVLAILFGAITVEDVSREWRAQIERCLQCGLVVRFLNSHEHIHMLPRLYPLAVSLATEYRIPNVRYATAETPRHLSAGPLVRNAIVKGLEVLARRHLRSPPLEFLGMEASGRLSPGDLERILPTLVPGRNYELMCHPGEFDPSEIKDPRLLGYHDWEGELQTLTSPEVRELLRDHGIRLIGYRDLVAATHETATTRSVVDN